MWGTTPSRVWLTRVGRKSGVNRVTVNDSAADRSSRWSENWATTGGGPLGLAHGLNNQGIVDDADKGSYYLYTNHKLLSQFNNCAATLKVDHVLLSHWLSGISASPEICTFRLLFFTSHFISLRVKQCYLSFNFSNLIKPLVLTSLLYYQWPQFPPTKKKKKWPQFPTKKKVTPILPRKNKIK